MKRSVTTAMGLKLMLAVAGCSGPNGDKGDKGDKGDPGQNGDRRWRTDWRSPQCVRRTK
jgi:hypothetical protein